MLECLLAQLPRLPTPADSWHRRTVLECLLAQLPRLPTPADSWHRRTVLECLLAQLPRLPTPASPSPAPTAPHASRQLAQENSTRMSPSPAPTAPHASVSYPGQLLLWSETIHGTSVSVIGHSLGSSFGSSSQLQNWHISDSLAAVLQHSVWKNTSCCLCNGLTPIVLLRWDALKW